MADGVVMLSLIDSVGSMKLAGAGKEGFQMAIALRFIQDDTLKQCEANILTEKKPAWLGALEEKKPHTQFEGLNDSGKFLELKNFAIILEQRLREALGYPTNGSPDLNYSFWDDALSWLGASVQVVLAGPSSKSFTWTTLGDGTVDFGRLCLLGDKFWILTDEPFSTTSVTTCCNYPTINQRVLMSIYGLGYIGETDIQCYGCGGTIGANQFIETETAGDTPSGTTEPQQRTPSNASTSCFLCKKPVSTKPEHQLCWCNSYCTIHGVLLSFSSGDTKCLRCLEEQNPEMRLKVLSAQVLCACNRRFKYEEEGLICSSKGHILCGLCSRCDDFANGVFSCRVCEGKCLIAQQTFQGQAFRNALCTCANCEAPKEEELVQAECLHRVHRSCQGPCKKCPQIKKAGK